MKKKRKVFLIPAAGLAAVFLYVLLHETGHLIVILSAGGTVTEFSIITAHVTAVNGNYTDLSDLWLHANGAALPVIVSFAYSLLYNRKTENSFCRLFSFFAVFITWCSLLAWVVIPVLWLFDMAPKGDDVTRFVYNFSHSHHPLIVSAAALMIMAAGISLMMYKGIAGNFQKEILNIRKGRE